MQKTVFQIKKVEVKEFKPKEGLSVIKITYSKNGEQKQITKSFHLSNPVEVVNKIILEVKSADKVIIEESDDILQNIYITRIENEEEIEEKLLFFFQSLCSKFSRIKTMNKANDYMKLYDEIKTTKLIL